ncbi:hypothetical protein SAMN04489712_101843 [Thermomonospora echinospora]|uniref:Uncharacterized protein n=1 Tax=Thermomonospora echinospora TaxID=1992 RepID=A0A1H5U4G7_9ACTN|nr:hypothetical protein [Thermomonospora echinospora]SEF69177.1 hypothetical protein SAMN04489712_101843 [Thermomonospora echinospora]
MTSEICPFGRDHSPFEGAEPTGRPVATVGGGQARSRDGDVAGVPADRYTHRA